MHWKRSNPNSNGNDCLVSLPLCKCCFIGKFSANGTKVETRKLVKNFAARCQWTYGNLPARSTDTINSGVTRGLSQGEKTELDGIHCPL